MYISAIAYMRYLPETVYETSRLAPIMTVVEGRQGLLVFSNLFPHRPACLKSQGGAACFALCSGFSGMPSFL
jgi:hypothetical protein